MHRGKGQSSQSLLSHPRCTPLKQTASYLHFCVMKSIAPRGNFCATHALERADDGRDDGLQPYERTTDLGRTRAQAASGEIHAAWASAFVRRSVIGCLMAVHAHVEAARPDSRKSENNTFVEKLFCCQWVLQRFNFTPSDRQGCVAWKRCISSLLKRTVGRHGREKLDKSGGVIKPAEGVDPQIVQPAPVPDPKSTPVIPPAGTLAVRPGRSPNSCGDASAAPNWCG
jgi:hypothetical protein